MQASWSGSLGRAVSEPSRANHRYWSRLEELLLLQEQEWRGETIHETRLLLPPFTV
jgi:hypothetical protein